LKANLRRAFDEVFVEGKVDVVDEVFTPGIVFHSTACPEGPTRGREEYKEFVREFLDAFTDIQIDVHDMVAEGDLVVSRATIRAKHVGTYHNIPPTKKSVAIFSMIMARADPSGICEEAWSAYDTMGLMQQLGVLPRRPMPKPIIWLILKLSRSGKNGTAAAAE
jgi:steroid delta-isomerase-like uncharacterized protein